MGDAPAFPEPTLGYRWIKANVYGGLVLAAVDLFLLALSRMFAVNDPDTSTAATIVFLVAGSILTAYGVGLWGGRIGAGLSRRLPLLLVRTWIALHAFMGLVLGLFVSMLQTIPETDSEPTETAATATILIGMTIVGVLLGALGGALQALVLR